MTTDLSNLAKNSPWVTSQAGGNMIASNDEAQTAPGSAPVDNLRDHLSQVTEEPTVTDESGNPIVGSAESGHGGEFAPATDSGEQAQGEGFHPSGPSWTKERAPDHGQAGRRAGRS